MSMVPKPLASVIFIALPNELLNALIASINSRDRETPVTISALVRGMLLTLISM